MTHEEASFEKVFQFLKPGPRPWTRTLKNLDPEKPGPWKTWTLKDLNYEKRGKQLDAKKTKIRRPHGLIY